ncbi:MAG: cob(I)yrinic acid a,c-diamide adenosyltransferase [Sulfolobales archaeon]|nr:cob(I)yrinic acid a,c-diamide adenosyltransferase [Sulfolobales archaeon]
MLLLVFYGKGKGKTTAALGTVLRFLGYGGKVVVLQFMKSIDSGEYRLYRKLIECGFNIKWFCLGTNEFVSPYDLSNEVVSITIAKSCGFLMHEYPKIAEQLKPNLIIFDELGLAAHLGLIPDDLVLSVLNVFPKNLETHAVVTGRYVPKYIRDMADLVTNCSEEKHYFREGFVNIKGLDF